MSGIFDQVINYAPPSLLKGTVTYKGTWSAATNTPTLINPPDSTTNGFYYVVSAAGTQFSLVFNIGDWIISNGSAWEKVDNTDAVSSVFGRTGAVVGVSTDYSAVGITATAVGASSPSTGAFTTLSATTPLAVASGGTGVASSTGTTNVVLSGSPTITTPVIAQINDANGNATVRLTGITSATDYLEIKNGIGVGSPLHVVAEGTSANIGMHLQPKGTGLLTISDGVDFNKGIRFRSVSSAASAITLIDAVSTAGRVITLPDATDTLVGKATTDTLTNKTLTSPTITGGALNGTLGATTPSSVAATTGTFSSTLGVTGVATLASGVFGSADLSTTDTGAVALKVGKLAGTPTNGINSYIAAQTTGGPGVTNGDLIYIPRSTSASNAAHRFFTESSGTPTLRVLIDTAGAAVTGALSATGQISSGATSSNIGLQVQAGARIMLDGGGDTWIDQLTANEVRVIAGGAAITTTSSTGLAVTGTLSASGNATFGTAGIPLYTYTSNPYTGITNLANGSTEGFLMRADTHKSQVFVSGAIIGDFTSTGLAVTGTVSTTGEMLTGVASQISSGKACIQFNGSTHNGLVFKETATASGASFVYFTRSDGNLIGSIARVTTTDAVVYNTTSDARLKENFRDFTDSGRLIDALKPRVFDWKDSDSNGKDVIGFVAQEEHAADPIFAHIGAVSVGDDDPTTIAKQWQRSDAALIPILVAELQSLRKRLAALESK